MPLQRSLPAIALLLLFLPDSRGALGETLHLKNGNVIQAPILAQRANVVIVDLGFTVISVPADEVERIVSDAPSGAEPAAAPDLYNVDSNRAVMTVKENIDRCAEAVVEVRVPTALGSGIVIHPSGYVVTNDHVVAGEHKITITVFRRTETELERVQFHKVRIVATHPDADVALLKIEEDGLNLATAPIGDSDALREGQTVFAIGSPLGFDRTVSEGIVSLKNRPTEGRLYIQTTTQINPGNSGGPLFNLQGQVIGVTNMKLSGLGVEGMGFAIPASTLVDFLKNRDAFAFDPRNPNAGFRYMDPPRSGSATN
ncbi:MAG: trypsin-like peptidase domain-containing protein [Planctomycetota bacterium]